MATIDRSIEPTFGLIDKVEMIKASATKLDNGIPVYSVNAGTQELVKIDLIFRAGVWFQDMLLEASTTNAMLDEGTSNRKAEELSEALDYFGSYLELDVDQDWAFVTVYSLNKHLKNVLPVVEELLKSSIFPQEELDIVLNNKKQGFLVDNKKGSYISRTRFSSILFGADHNYSYKLQLEDFDKLKRDHVKSFYEKFYRSTNCKIVVSGLIEDSVLKLLNQYFGGSDWKGNIALNSNDNSEFISDLKKKHFIEKDDSVQSTIRIGRVLFNKIHTDYHGMKMVNTILGGYFGSRLMANIREEKGYTYGIGSRMVSMNNAGYIYISTEVGTKVCDDAVNEIYKEIDKLRNELVSSEELNLVKNYMMGDFLRSADGPFALADKFKKIMFYDLSYSYYDEFVKTVKTITPEQIQSLADQYLNPDDLYELVVGKK